MGAWRPAHDEAGAMCRNAAIELEDVEDRIRSKLQQPEFIPLQPQTRIGIELALQKIRAAAAELHQAADDFYREEAKTW